MTYYIICSLQLQAWKIIMSLALKNIFNTKHHLISPRLPAASPPEPEAREKLSPGGLWCSAHEHSCTTSPGSLWFISPATTESILATPNYPDGWQVCLTMFCQYHLVLRFHPSLLLAAKKTRTHKSSCLLAGTLQQHQQNLPTSLAEYTGRMLEPPGMGYRKLPICNTVSKNHL